MRPVFALMLMALSATPAAAQAPLACGPAPDQMQAAVATRPGGPEVLEMRDVPTPRPAPGELLVRVHYAGLNPADWKRQERGQLAAPGIPGSDFSGVVVGSGGGVAGFACGDLVAGNTDPSQRGGSYAEYLVVPARDVAHPPRNLGPREAAAYPTAVIAAWRYLIVAADVQPGERVLVHGGAGGVGSMLVQMAKARGAWVAATASARNHDYLRGLGADQVIDYTQVRFEDAVQGLDVVVDTVGGDTLARSPAVLRPGGRLVSLAGDVSADACEKAGIRCPAEPDWDVAGGLAYAAPGLASGQLRVSIEREYPLAEAAAAQEHSRSGRTRGKLVLVMPGAPAAR